MKRKIIDMKIGDSMTFSYDYAVNLIALISRRATIVFRFCLGVVIV